MMNRKIHFKIILFVLIFMMLFPLFAVKSFAGEQRCTRDYERFLKDNYELESSDWVCSETTGYPYKLIIEVPLKRTCDLKIDDSGTWAAGPRKDPKEILENCTTTTCTTTDCTPEAIGTIKDALTNKIGTRTAYLAGYMTIYSNKQLEMSDVDINIVDGKVKVTGLIDDDTAGWNVIYEKYKIAINGFLGLCVLSCILVFIVSSIKLGATAGNPTERKKVMKAMLLSGIGTAGLGGVLIFFGFFFNLL